MFINDNQTAATTAIEALGVHRDFATQIYEELTPYEVSMDKIVDVVTSYIDDSRISLAVIEILTNGNEAAYQYIAENKHLI